MLFIGTNGVWDVITIVISSLIGIFGVSAALEGYIVEHMAWYERLICIVGGLALIYPGLVTDLVGLTLVGAVVAIQIIKRSKNKTCA